MSAGYMAKCGLKKHHATQAEAEAHRTRLIRMRKYTRANSNTYWCNVCGGFHAGRLGKPNRGKGRRIKTRPIYHTQ